MTKKLSNDEMVDVVEMEGLDYAIQHYMSYTEVADPQLAKLWKTAKETLDAISEILEKAEELREG